MEQEKARALQRELMQKGVAALMLAGTVADVELHEQTITAIGEAWELPLMETQAFLQTLQQEREAVRSMEAGQPAQHACEGTDILYTPTGADSMRILWGLFETATRLPDANKRILMYRMSKAIAESFHLDEWICDNP